MSFLVFTTLIIVTVTTTIHLLSIKEAEANSEN
jgi:hypothetical protein